MDMSAMAPASQVMRVNKFQLIFIARLPKLPAGPVRGPRTCVHWWNRTAPRGPAALARDDNPSRAWQPAPCGNVPWPWPDLSACPVQAAGRETVVLEAQTKWDGWAPAYGLPGRRLRRVSGPVLPWL